MTYEDLLLEADSEKLIVREKNIPGYNGRIYKNRIAINKDIKTSTEKACVLAEELGHYYTTVGDILDQSDAGNRKQEFRARLHGYNRMVGLMGIIRAYEHGCRNKRIYTVVHEYCDYHGPKERHDRVGRERHGEYKHQDNYKYCSTEIREVKAHNPLTYGRAAIYVVKQGSYGVGHPEQHCHGRQTLDRLLDHVPEVFGADLEALAANYKRIGAGVSRGHGQQGTGQVSSRRFTQQAYKQGVAGVVYKERYHDNENQHAGTPALFPCSLQVGQL